jgi:tetratricopeptide (TPR) repeat protein
MIKMPSFRFLRITLIAGLILLFITGLVITIYSLFIRDAGGTARQHDNFYRILREYDIALSEHYGTEREYDFLNQELNRLERSAISVEAWLSVLKRRRALSKDHPPSLVHYHRSINNALAVYPFSQPIAAVAAASLIKDSALNENNEMQIRNLLPLINNALFNPIRLGLHVLLGDFNSPQRASNITSDVFSDGTEYITINLAILKIIRGDFRGANADIQVMLNTISDELPASMDFLRFAAEFHYDFGDLLRSAEIFSMINDDEANVRQADALYLAGYRESAIGIWNLMADVQSESSLYNLALIALEMNNFTRAIQLLEKLNNLEIIRNKNNRQFGLIRYSRLLDFPAAALTLQTNKFFPPAEFLYIDLEICKRHTQVWNLDRRIAETWLLLDRHHDNEEIHKWATWHFFFQRRFDEIPILINRLRAKDFSPSWINLYRALHQMNAGNLQAAENLLLSIPADEADWTVYANLGRIYDGLLSPSRALIQYELAAAKLQSDIQQNPKNASIVQQRIARCFTSLGRHSEAIRVLLYALDLDPDNMSARLDLERLIH